MISNDSLKSDTSLKSSTAFIVNFEESAQLNSFNTTTVSSSTTTLSTNTHHLNSSNLQDAFKKYREEKIRARNIYESNKQRRKSFRANPQRMWKLRKKFVAHAKKFLGVPYAKKYFNPGTPEYDSKLFLDCCGLVRRVMRDLEEDFGFRIGSGNQNYMWDTLPIPVNRLEDVKPGDLVFISGIYFNPKMKKQPHGITHVEIMLGDGEKTIGARWNNGKVSIFDSYKFESKSFHSAQYYFRSLDPWLWGYCRSFCSMHGWRYNTSMPNKRSIFYPKSETTEKKDKSGRSDTSLTNKSDSNVRKISTARSKKKKTKRKTKKTKIPKPNKPFDKISNVNEVKLSEQYQGHHLNEKNMVNQKTEKKVPNELEEDDAEAQVDQDAEAAQEEIDDDCDVQYNNSKKHSIQSITECDLIDNKQGLDVENVLRLLSEYENSESDGDSVCVHGNSDSDFDIDINSFYNAAADTFSQYSRSELRNLEDEYYNNLDTTDKTDNDDDDNDIRISAIENNFRILSIDN